MSEYTMPDDLKSQYTEWVEETKRSPWYFDWWFQKSNELLDEVGKLKSDIDSTYIRALCRVDPEFKKAYFEERKKEIEAGLMEYYRFYEEQVRADAPPIRRLMAYRLRNIQKLEAELKRVSWALQADSRQGNGITDEMIARAKEYPFERLVEIGRGGMIRCPFHRDKSPSMLIKNGFAFCFSENKSWDTIAFIMEQEQLSFLDAVKRLQ